MRSSIIIVVDEKSSFLCEAVENLKKCRGRPRQFDENEALDKAIELFWTNGFDATCLDDLCVAMGIGRPSIYNAFGDKEALFMRCLARYTETVRSVPMQILETSDSIESSVYGYLKAVAEYSTRDPRRTGCLLGSVASVANDPKVREFLSCAIGLSQERIKKRLQGAVDSGELPESFPVESRARRVMNATLALATRARLGAQLAELMQDVEDGTSSVFAPL